MTRVLESYVEDIAGSTTTSTSTTNAVLSTNHTGEASTQYMVFAFIKVAKNVDTTDLRCSLVNTTAGVTYQNPSFEVRDTTDSFQLMMLGNYTAAGTPVSNTIELRVWNETSGTITWSEAVIFLIKVDSTDGIGVSTGNSATDVTIDKISLSMPMATGDDVYIFYAVECLVDADLAPNSAVVDIAGTDMPGMFRRWTPKDTASRWLHHAAGKITLTSGTKDIDLECAALGSSDDVTFSNARMFVLRKDTFDAAYSVLQATRQTNATDDTFVDVSGLSETQTLPAVDHLVIASAAYDSSSTTLSGQLKFQQSIGGSNADIVSVIQEPQNTADRMAFTLGYRLEATAVEHIWKFQQAPESTATCATLGAIMVLQVEASPSGSFQSAWARNSNTVMVMGNA